MLIMSLCTEFFIEVMSTRGFALIILSNFHKTLLIIHLALRELNVAFSTAMLEEMVALDPFQWSKFLLMCYVLPWAATSTVVGIFLYKFWWNLPEHQQECQLTQSNSWTLPLSRKEIWNKPEARNRQGPQNQSAIWTQGRDDATYHKLKNYHISPPQKPTVLYKVKTSVRLVSSFLWYRSGIYIKYFNFFDTSKIGAFGSDFVSDTIQV